MLGPAGHPRETPRGCSSSVALRTSILSTSSITDRTELHCYLSGFMGVCPQHVLECVFVAARGRLQECWVCVYMRVCSQ